MDVHVRVKWTMHTILYVYGVYCTSCWGIGGHVQDPNVRLIRELKAEIKRLKRIIEDGQLVSG